MTRRRSVLEDLRPPGGWWAAPTTATKPKPPAAHGQPVEPEPTAGCEDDPDPLSEPHAIAEQSPTTVTVPETPPRRPAVMSVRERLPIGPWARRAACRGIDPGLFYPARGESTREAKDVCAGCLVRGECLDYALAAGEKFGIWGGKSERERRRIRRQRTAVRASGEAVA